MLNKTLTTLLEGICMFIICQLISLLKFYFDLFSANRLTKLFSILTASINSDYRIPYGTFRIEYNIIVWYATNEMPLRPRIGFGKNRAMINLLFYAG